MIKNRAVTISYLGSDSVVLAVRKVYLRRMADRVRLYEKGTNPRYIRKVVDVLENSGLIIYPTDTVYALGCSIDKVGALEKVARIKGVKLAKANFSFMCADISDMSSYIKQIDNHTFRILKKYLPGSFTFILPGSSNLPKVFRNKKTVGVRIPDNKIATEIVHVLGKPIVCTSVHDEDKILDYMTDPDQIFNRWHKQIDIFVDGGVGGLESSTIVDLCGDEPEILRQGKGVFLD